MRKILTLLIAAGVLALPIGCEKPRPLATADDFKILRTYGWETTVPDPQAQWNPETYQILARSAAGFVLYDEGRGRQQYFGSKEKRESYHPVWVSRVQFAFGPRLSMVQTSDGPVPNSEGLTVVTLREFANGQDSAMAAQNLTNSGTRPRVWGKDLVAQFKEQIQIVNSVGDVTEFGPGFFPEPQRDGPGICWQEKPVIETDYWSGSDSKRGKLVIRWNPKQISELPNAIEARWTADGGVVATVLRSEPPTGQPWWNAGTDVMYVAGPKAMPVLVATDARSPAPHPQQPVCAAVGKNGSLVICRLDGSDRRMLAEQGDHPQWSWDGMRLLAEETIAGKPEIRYLKVYILKVVEQKMAGQKK